MSVLAIETATAVCAAALVRDGMLVAEELLDEKYVHAEKLMTLVDRVLEAAKEAVARVGAVAVSAGPGSFTGLRIGLSVAKGLVYATGRPLVAVPTLDALALKGAAAWEGRILCALQARHGEVYSRLFNARSGVAEPLDSARDVRTDALVAEITGAPVLVLGDAAVPLQEALAQAPERRQFFRFAEPALARCSAASVGILGERLLREGHTDDPASLEPHYIKEFFLKTDRR